MRWSWTRVGERQARCQLEARSRTLSPTAAEFPPLGSTRKPKSTSCVASSCPNWPSRAGSTSLSGRSLPATLHRRSLGIPPLRHKPFKNLVFAIFQENHFAWLGKEEDLHIVQRPWVLVAESRENWIHARWALGLPAWLPVTEQGHALFEQTSLPAREALRAIRLIGERTSNSYSAFTPSPGTGG